MCTGVSKDLRKAIEWHKKTIGIYPFAEYTIEELTAAILKQGIRNSRGGKIG